MFRSIFTRKFLLNLVLALALVALAFAGAYYFLLQYTRQEGVVVVPELSGYDLFEAETILKDLTLEGIVVDSLYLPKKRGGEIVDQEPIEGSTVKEHRKIYLTIARYNAPMVRIPDVLNQTLALAVAKLESFDLKINKLINRPSDCTDCVIALERNGNKITPGTPVEKGAAIDLIIGEGATGEKIPIPMLFGLALDEAQLLLNKEGLNIGATPYIGCETADDSAKARVFRQLPEPAQNAKISRGSTIDVYLSPDESKIPPVNLDSIRAQLK